MFIRRHYYDLNNGQTIWSYAMKGNFNIQSIEDELNIVPELQKYTIENLGYFEWLEPNEEIEAKMNGLYNITVDISTKPHQLIFTEKSISIPEDEVYATEEDYENALKDLGVIKYDN